MTNPCPHRYSCGGGRWRLVGSGNKSNGRKREGLDDIDRQILEIKATNPDATLREIAKKIGITASTVCKRLKRIPDQPWIKDFSTKLDELLPLAVENMAERLGSNDAVRRDAGSDKILSGLGLLRNKHDHQHSGSLEVNEDNVVEYLLNCDFQTYEHIRERVNAGKQTEPDA